MSKADNSSSSNSLSVFVEHLLLWRVSGAFVFIRLSKPQAMPVKVFSLKRGYSEWVVGHFIDLAPLTA